MGSERSLLALRAAPWCGLADLPADDPDQTFVRAAAAGDADAFEALVRRYEQRVVSLCGTLVGPEDAEDLAQEVFVRVYRALPSFREASAFRTWLYRIAMNVARSYRAHSWRRAAVWVDSGADETSAFDPEDSADFEALWLTRDAVERALESLPHELRVAVVLRDLHGLEYREISETTGVPIGTVESRIFRARRRLRRALEPQRVT